MDRDVCYVCPECSLQKIDVDTGVRECSRCWSRSKKKVQMRRRPVSDCEDDMEDID